VASFLACGVKDGVEVRQLGLVLRQPRHQQVLLDAGGQRVVADQQHVDVDPPGILLRLDLSRNLRGGRLREADAGDEVGTCLAVGFEAVLGELKIAGGVDYVQRDRRGRKLRARGGRHCRRGCHAGEHAAPRRSDAFHVFPPFLCVVVARRWRR
jgi:hypothetical protein